METGKVASTSKFIELFTILMLLMCAVLTTISFLAVFNTYRDGWSGLLPVVIAAVGLTYVGRTSEDKWTLRDLPGSHFALSIGAGLLLGGIGVAAKVYLLS